jgi:hypothetical protein
MKFRDISERVKGGKLDPLSKMGKQKLTGQEVARYYKDNPKAKQAARDKTVKKAIELALDLGGAQSYAIKEIEKLKRGLSKMPVVQQALRTANEEMTSTSSVAMPEIPLGRKHKVMKRKELDEVTRQEVDAMKKVSKDMQKVLVSYQKVANIGDKELKNTIHNKDYEKVLDARNTILKKIGTLNTKMLLQKEAVLGHDFGTNPFSKKEAEQAKKLARQYSVKVKPHRNPKSKNHLEFHGGTRNLQAFYRNLQMIMNESLEENKEKLSPAKAQYKKFNIIRTKLYRFVKAKTKAHKFAIDDLMLMTSPKVIEGMYKQNPRGFTRMMDKMYPNEREKMTKMDFTVLGDFIDARGKVIKGQGDKVDESTSLNEETILYRVKDIKKPELDKFKSSARLMKLKINIKQSPRGKETIIRLEGGKKQIRDFDAVARGKSSYGDPSLAMKEEFDLNEESATMKKVRQVVKKKGMMNIDGMKLDLTTASMIASVYDKVNPQNKKRMDSLKLPQLVNLTMKVAGKGKMKKEDAVERAKELADLKAKHKREVEQEKDEIAATKQTNESLWRNIHNKRKSGKKMRKPGEKGAPTAQDFKNARGEAVSPAQQAAIAISKKERGEKPKNECADEKDFKPHKMYKGDKEVMANTYADHVKYDKMGYTHEKPKKEALDAKDKPFVKDLVKKLRGGSKTHAKQADDLEKAMNTESMSRARRDAMRDMGTRKDRDDDGNPVATADDRKAADKNVVMQIRRVTDLSKPAQIELRNGKKVMLKPADAKMMMKKFDAIRKPQDRLKVQNAMNDKKMTVQGLKRLLGK